MIQVRHIEPDLIRKYDCLAPRYTSYPTAPQFDSSFGEKHYCEHAETSNASLLPRDLSIYVHIPFCHSLCYFCGCNKVITQANNKKVNEYLESLMTEIAMRGKLFNDGRLVTQIHFGGGTPNFLSIGQLTEILDEIASHFHLDLPNNLDISIEIDPRAIATGDISNLAKIGFTRFSIGIQDFSPQVQKAINREQAEADSLASIAEAMSVSASVNVDLITGLPLQTPESFSATLEKVIDTGVTRIAAYNFAYLPERIKAQRKIDEKSLPDPELRLQIANTAREELLTAGYRHIGMDHFALADDSLAQAQLDGSLQRNFQGYSTHRDTDLIGIGASAISKFDTAFSQNSTVLSTYNELISNKSLPIVRGLSLTSDDRLRASLIQQIMCLTEVDLTHKINRYVERNSERTLRQYFEHELNCMGEFISDQLIIPTDIGFDITEEGRYFMRQIAAVFDIYLNSEGRSKDGSIIQFSRTV